MKFLFCTNAIARKDMKDGRSEREREREKEREYVHGATQVDISDRPIKTALGLDQQHQQRNMWCILH